MKGPPEFIRAVKEWNKIPCFKGVPCPQCGKYCVARKQPKDAPGWAHCSTCGRWTTDKDGNIV